MINWLTPPKFLHQCQSRLTALFATATQPASLIGATVAPRRGAKVSAHRSTFSENEIVSGESVQAGQHDHHVGSRIVVRADTDLGSVVSNILRIPHTIYGRRRSCKRESLISSAGGICVNRRQVNIIRSDNKVSDEIGRSRVRRAVTHRGEDKFIRPCPAHHRIFTGSTNQPIIVVTAVQRVIASPVGIVIFGDRNMTGWLIAKSF